MCASRGVRGDSLQWCNAHVKIIKQVKGTLEKEVGILGGGEASERERKKLSNKYIQAKVYYVNCFYKKI